MRLYGAALEVEPDNHQLLSKLAVLSFQTSNDTLSTQLFEKLLPVPEYHAIAVRHLAQLALRRRAYEESLKFCNEWIKDDHDSPLVYQTRGSAYAGLFHTPEAMRDYDRSLQLDSNSHAAVLKKELRTRFSTALPEKFFDPSLENKKDDYDSMTRDCIRLLHTMDENEAIKKIAEAIAFKPERSEAHFFRSLIHHRNQHYKEEIEQLELAYKGLPKSLVIKLNIPKEFGKTTKIDLLGRQKRIEAVDILYRIGRAYSALGDGQKALTYYNKANSVDSTDSRVHFALADAYRRMGDTRRARAERKLAKESHDHSKEKDCIEYNDMLYGIMQSQDKDKSAKAAAHN